VALINKISFLFLCLLGILPAVAQVVPEIVAVTPDVCVPGAVNLKVINCTSCISFEWQLGAGAPYKPGPDKYSTIITAAGWYDATVIIKTTSGAKLAIGKKKAFLGRSTPEIKMRANKPTFCSGRDSLILTDSTQNVVSRDWLVDGNIFYNGPKILKYALNGPQGYKRIFLQVRDSWACQGSLLRDTWISIWDSVKLSMNPNITSGCAPKYVQLRPSFDTTAQSLTSFDWQFPGASPLVSKLRIPPKLYYSKGDTFDVFLKLKTNKGCIYNYKANNLLSFGDTTLLAIAASKNSLCVHEKLNLTVTGGKRPNPIWSILGPSFLADSLIVKSINVSFNDTGSPSIKVSENDRGCISYAQYKSKISILGPIAKFTSDFPFYCGVPKTLKFTNTSVEDPKGTKWQWLITDNSNTLISKSTTFNDSYVTNSGKNYNVKLVANGNNGCKDSLTIMKASAFGHLDSNFKVIPNPICPGNQVMLVAKEKSVSKKSPIYYNFKFYDKLGNVVSSINSDSAKHIYYQIGDYSAKLVLWNNEKCKDSLRLKDTIHVISPKASIFVTDTFACIGQPIKCFIVSKDKKPGIVQRWFIRNLDSAMGLLDAFNDTIYLRLPKTGRYQISLLLMDTNVKGCSYETFFPSKVRISGIGRSISASPVVGCAPLQVSYKSTTVFNVNYKVTKGTQTYRWKSNDKGMISFTDSLKQNTDGWVKKGYHGAYQVFSNESGCVDSTASVMAQAGLTAGFSADKWGVCKGNEIQLSNASSPWTQSIKYFCDSPSIVFSPSATVGNPKVKFNKRGTYKISIVAKYNTCSDTFSATVNVFGIKADFFTPDSVTFCAPRLINIINRTVGSLYNKWRFGDGDTTFTFLNEIAGHLYTKNNNSGYPLTLIATDANGCVDTMVQQNYIRIVGPEPDFEVKNILGCEPLRVEFVNKSKAFNRIFMDYDNGIVADTVLLKYYNYTVTDKSFKVQKFVPRLLLSDSMGCSAIKISDDSITVLKGPEAKHTFTSTNFLRGTEGCANDLLVKFSNTSRFFTKIWWDFDSDNVIDIVNQNSPSFYYTKPGVFYPTIYAENYNGCKDTFFKDSIVVWQPPVAAFTESTDSSCAVDPVKFYSKSTFKYPIVSYKWNFGEQKLVTDTSTKINTFWRYRSPFDHYVTLDVEDKKGCKSQVARNIYIFDTAGPKKPELAFISVRNNSQVDCYWQKTKLGNFLQYHVYLDSIALYKKYSTYNRSDTSLSWNYGNQVNNKRFCFTVRMEDTCDQLGKFGNSHCTIVLRDSVFEPYHIQLNWLAYDWWANDLSHYDVFRKDNPSGSFKRISSVRSNRQTFTDSFLCDQDYWYYVEAVHVNGAFKSRSNEIKSHPIYIKPQGIVNTTLVTVENNDYTKVNWEKYPIYIRNYSYVLERSLTGLSGSFMPVVQNSLLTANDLNADVHSKMNFYQVKFRDHCGEYSKPGVVSNSMYLQTVSAGRNSTAVIWNPYKYWYSGVKEYNLQVKDANGVFQIIRTVGPGTQKMDSIDIEKLGLDSICMRVYAVKDTISQDTSFSNEVCLVPASYLMLPNSFTPDDNGLNEIFKPSAGFIYKKSVDPQKRFDFSIFNRWGQQVFFTDDADIGWNGFFQNKLCAPGLYIYTVKALGYDGVPHFLKGTVMLLR